MVEAEVLPASGALREANEDLSRLLELVGKPRWATSVLVALGLLSSLAEAVGITLILLFIYAVTGQTDTAIIGGGAVGNLLRESTDRFGGTVPLAVLIMVLIVVRATLSLAYSLVSVSISEGISERARNMVHHQYLTASYEFVQGHEQSQLLEILGTESWYVAGAYSNFTRLIINCCSILVFGIFLLAISWKITLVALAGFLLISAGLRHLSAPARTLGFKTKEVHQSLAEHMLKTLQAMRAIRAYAQESAHQRRFEDSSGQARQTSMALVRLSSWIGPATDVGYFAILCIIIAGSGLWGVSFAVTLAAVALLYRLQPQTRELESKLLSFAQMQPQLHSLRMMIEPDKDYPPVGSQPVHSIGTAIQFSDVHFAYTGNDIPVLDGVSFSIPAGVTTAIVGTSGAGKTTIVNLLLRLYQPRSGRILVDGTSLDVLRRDDWLSMIGVAGQDVDLVEGTVIDNIRMSNENASQEAVIEAARSAGVAEFIEPLAEGYDTWIGQEGLRFSGGQRQRIGLARALLRNPQFLILDEAMSALDRGLEDRIRHEIENRLAGRTMLIITHRLETVANAGHAIWIADGQVKAEGEPTKILSLADTRSVS